jgi:hypothetical protein
VGEPRLGRNGHVEDLEEDAGEIGEVPVVGGVVADREEVGLVHPVHVGREARNLELGENPGPRRVVEVDDEERVGLLEGDDVAAPAVEADRADVLPGGEVVQDPDRMETGRSWVSRGGRFS